MNFLAHYVLAVQDLTPVSPLAYYICGNALPDILPLARPRHRLKTERLSLHAQTAEDAALRSGVLIHFATDAAFHKTTAFAQVQKNLSSLLDEAGFVGMRIRNFFAAHILSELALDAALLRREPTLADTFYDLLADTDIAVVTSWAEHMTNSPLPTFPAVLSNFSGFPYLHSYTTNEGLAEGFNRLCKRARQDTFEGKNGQRLLEVTGHAVSTIEPMIDRLLTETADVLHAV